MWASLGITALFVLLLIIWWAAVTEMAPTDTRMDKWVGPTGIAGITAVFVTLMFFTYK